MKNQEGISEILKWGDQQKISAHDVFDDLNDNHEAIECFFAEECPKQESGMVLSIEDAEILAYEYAKRLIELYKQKGDL